MVTGALEQESWEALRECGLAVSYRGGLCGPVSALGLE
jgi:hypothetical protein